VNWNFVFMLLFLYGASLLVYMGVKRFVITKYDIKKKYMIIFMLSLFVVQIAVTYLFPKATIIQYPFTVLFVVTVLVMMDILKKEREIKNRPVVGRPKPKLKRVNSGDSEK
jgi:hypothetical protein